MLLDVDLPDGHLEPIASPDLVDSGKPRCAVVQFLHERVEDTAVALDDDLHHAAKVADRADQPEAARQPSHERPKADALHHTADLDPICHDRIRHPARRFRSVGFAVCLALFDPIVLGHPADRICRRFG